MSRKSRYNVQPPTNFVWKAGAYIRLSKEDMALTAGNSQSVLTQKRLIDKYLSEHSELKLIDYFIDDGYTGTDMERPCFQQLKEGYESGKINCVIVKDLSRLARNNEESSKLVKVIFPFFKVRFISINDGLDTFANPDSVHRLDVSFKNIMNDEYSRDISVKERTASNARRKRGEYLGSFAPYGYKKDPADVHKLIIDEPAAETVKLIFDEYLNNQNCARIARILMERGVPSPLLYKKMKGSKMKNSVNQREELAWSSSSVRRILESEVYVGNLIQCKTGVISYKNHKVVKKDKEDMIRVEGAHKPIIPSDVFFSVQTLLQSKYKAKGKSVPSTFGGLVMCGRCGRLMSVTRYLGKGKYRAYFCNSYYKKRIECANGRIKESVIETAVLQILNQFISQFTDAESIIKNVASKRKRPSALKQPQSEVFREIDRLGAEKRGLYAKYKSGEFTVEEYVKIKQSLESSIEKLRCKAANLQADDENENKILKDADGVFQFLSGAAHINEITRELAQKFVKRVKVYAPDKIEIEFTFSDELQRLKSLDWAETLNFEIPYIALM